MQAAADSDGKKAYEMCQVILPPEAYHVVNDIHKINCHEIDT